MKTFKKKFTTIITGILSFPYLLMAQNEETYIDDLGVQDSSYMEQDLLTEGTQSSNSVTTVIIIVVVVILIAAIFYFFMRKKKK